VTYKFHPEALAEYDEAAAYYTSGGNPGWRNDFWQPLMRPFTGSVKRPSVGANSMERFVGI
jgi:hypothetical protein